MQDDIAAQGVRKEDVFQLYFVPKTKNVCDIYMF